MDKLKQFIAKNLLPVVMIAVILIICLLFVAIFRQPVAVFNDQTENGVVGANSFPTALNSWGSGNTIESAWANALEAKIGIDGSAVTTSLDYKINALNSTSSMAQLTTIGDVGCTDCLNATEIEDIYVLTAGDTISGNLTVNGTTTMGALTFPNYDGTAGYVLTTDGSGNIIWAEDDTAAGSFATTSADYWFNNTSGITGNTNITTLGTIGAGVWQGTAVADGYVADDITASNYLPLSGGTLTGTTTHTAITSSGGYDIIFDWTGTGTPNICLGDCY